MAGTAWVDWLTGSEGVGAITCTPCLRIPVKSPLPARSPSTPSQWPSWRRCSGPSLTCTPARSLALHLAAVPILAPLSRDEKLTLLDAFEERTYRAKAVVVRQVRQRLSGKECLPGWLVGGHGLPSCQAWAGRLAGRGFCISRWHDTSPPIPCTHMLCIACTACLPVSPSLQGEPGDLFYIIKEGEAVVYQDSGAGSRKRINQLFKADFFGEAALLSDEPRWVLCGLVCL